VGRTGRRPGVSTTREEILEVARRRFAEAGYDASSMRAIAAEAGVDASVVVHFFGSKEGLFRAAVGWPFDPSVLADEIQVQGRGDVGAGLARTFLRNWDDPVTGPALLAVLRSAMTHEVSAGLLREFLRRHVFSQAARLGLESDPRLRVDLVAAQLVGAAVLRYGLRIEPIASQSIEELVRWLAPVLNHHLGFDERGQRATGIPPPNGIARSTGDG
jgi:AcrR family transcriptional regulator